MRLKVVTPILVVLCLAALSVEAQQKKKQQLKVKATAHSVVLSWTQGTVSGTCSSGSGTTAVTSNGVYRATVSGGEGTTPFATVTPANTTYTDLAVTAGTTYFYQVTATNCNGESAHSSEASAAVPNTPPPNAPTGLTGTAQ